MEKVNVSHMRLIYPVIVLIAAAASVLAAPVEELIRTNQPGRMITKENDVQYIAPQQPPVPAPTNQWLAFGDALRTLALSRATVRFTDWSQLYMKDHSRLEVHRQLEETNAPVIDLQDGQIYVTSRGEAVAIPVRTPHVQGVPKGTEFLVNVDAAAGHTEVTMFEGEVDLRTEGTNATVRSGEQAVATAQAILIRPVLEATNIVQWWIYYPAVLDALELGLNPTEQQQLADSLEAYRRGNLLRALQLYLGSPTSPNPATDAQRAYLAALLLGVGAVDRAETQLDAIASNLPPVRALRIMISAVAPPIGANETAPKPELLASQPPQSASEWVAVSYAHQATNNLSGALKAARAAVTHSPRFGFGWARVAELEFSFGHIRPARDAVQRALELSPRNAQAHAVHGFLLAAENKRKDAIAAFDEAIRLDPALANGWLGRGLCQFRWGNRHAALSDLQTAAIQEPRRSLIRSYAGKAFSDVDDSRLANQELDYAKKLDGKDPTPWLYSALEKWQENRVNEAVRDLERSIELNDNRAVYRSRLLLDQDRAVRSASLAKIYQNAGLDEVALNEAAKAVSYDYANHSAHQFMAESYDALRDPTRFNLRYETVWFNELLLANVLSPVGASVLSQNISQQEYSRMFERDRFGALNSTEVRSDGQIREIASQYGTYRDFSYTLDLDYQHNDGVRPNNDLDRLEWYTQLKFQITPQDSLFVLTKYQEYESGDNFQHYDPADASTRLRFEESQAPIVLAAMHREWQSGIHTALLGGLLQDEVESRDSPAYVLDLQTNSSHALSRVVRREFAETRYADKYTAYLGEVNQVFQGERHVWIAGGRFQAGSFQTTSLLDQPGANGVISPLLTNRFSTPVASSLDEPFSRTSLYTYLTYEIWDRCRLTGGAAYDHLDYPDGFRSMPVASGTQSRDRLSPKAALTWDLHPAASLRGVYAQSVGGVSFDESVRLEPTQLAGFCQAFRTVISEAEAGSVIAPVHEVAGAALDLKLASTTLAGVQAYWLHSDVEQRLGVFEGTSPVLSPQSAAPSSTPEQMDYRERSLALSLHQLIGKEWSLGASYRLAESRLDWDYPAIPAGTRLEGFPSTNPSLSRTESALLHRIGLRLGFDHLSGFFARAESAWYLQDNDGYPNAFHGERPGESLYQLDLFAGYRFWRRRGAITVGCLNLTDQDYRLNSLTPYPDLPRERVWMGRVRLTF